MKNRHLYAFGDSFCSYAWPMWPELVGTCYKKVYNFGLPGCGNFYIFHKALIELNLLDLDEKDTVIIQWSEPLRIDYTDSEGWIALGIKSAEMLVEKKADYINNDYTATLKHLSYMLSLAIFLNTKKCRWFYIFMSDDSISYQTEINIPHLLLGDYERLINSLLEFKDHIVDEKSITRSKKDNNAPVGYSMTDFDKSFFADDHPTPIYTYKYIEECLNKKLFLDIDKVKKYSILSEELLNKCKVNIKNKRVNNFNLLQRAFIKKNEK
jgi:hypothetical protein